MFLGRCKTSFSSMLFIFNVMNIFMNSSASDLPAHNLASCSGDVDVSALFSAWVCRFGVPTIIISDWGPQFISSWWGFLSGYPSIKHAPTTAYHPKANSMVEWFHRLGENFLRTRLSEHNARSLLHVLCWDTRRQKPTMKRLARNVTYAIAS